MDRRRRSRTAIEPPVGETLTLRVESLVFGGAGLAHAEDGRVVLVAYAAPGELVEALVERVHPDYLEAVTTRVIEPSRERVESRCPLFGECGGCQLQHLNYPAQLAAKEAIVRTQLRRIGHLDESLVRPIVGAANPWGYRNHARFSTGNRYGDLGFIRRRGRGLLKVDDCPIAGPRVNELLPGLQGHGAGLHQVQVRYSGESDSLLISPAMPGVDIATGQRSYQEQLAGHVFRVSADSFFQVNHAQAEQMVRLVGEALPARGELLVDAFAGVGTFAVIFAGRFDRVLAIEEAAGAARDARENAGCCLNIEVRRARVEDELPGLAFRPDAVLLDPPRPGCAPRVLESLVASRPPCVVYVSCNPATLARDLHVLADGGYTVDYVTPLDMFPQTGHIECVARLSWPGGEAR